MIVTRSQRLRRMLMTIVVVGGIYFVYAQYEILTAATTAKYIVVDVSALDPALETPAPAELSTPRHRRRRRRFSFGNYSTTTLAEEELTAAADDRRNLRHIYDFVVKGHDTGPAADPLSRLEAFFYDIAMRPSGFLLSSLPVNLHPFKFALSPRVCRREGGGPDDVFLVVYIHSCITHFERRDAIRRTWGNVTQYEVPVRLVFVLGKPANDTLHIQRRVAAEWRRHGDLVQEDSVDSYLNMTYKAVAALKWISNRCRHARFVLKADDDVLVNMFSLIAILSSPRIDGDDDEDDEDVTERRHLLCNHWFPARVPRLGKWLTERSAWRYGSWPPMCQGMAFVLTTDLVLELFDASFHVPFLWMDDVYLTGFVTLLLRNFQTIKLNERYLQGVSSSWYLRELILNGSKTIAWRSYLFVDVSDDMSIMDTAWYELLRLERNNPLLRKPPLVIRPIDSWTQAYEYLNLSFKIFERYHGKALLFIIWALILTRI